MRRAAFALVGFAALAACNAEPPAAPAATAAQESPEPARVRSRDDDRGNLLAMRNGGALISRTAESDLEQSALHAIDGAAFTRWVSPAGDASMSAVFSLAAPARVERVGVVPGEAAHQTPAEVRFELSNDGSNWQDALIIEPVAGKPSTQPIPPVEASYVRVSLMEPAEDVSLLRSVIVEGQPLAPPAPPRFAGCWKLNTFDATIDVDGSRLRGTIEDEPSTFLDGGIDGRVARLMWFRGPMWGYALATTSLDENALSIATLHEEILIGSFGRAWIGGRCTDAPGSIAPHEIDDILDVAGRWSMFGLVFDRNDTLVGGASDETIRALLRHLEQKPGRYRIVSREFRETTPEANQKRADTRLASLRAALAAKGADLTQLDLVAAGSRSDKIESDHAIMRELSSRMDLERITN